MTETKSEQLVRGGPPRGVGGGDADRRIREERQTIGRQLHQGILQELTVAGLRLKVLENTSPPPAGAIAEFSEWLRERQAELRQLVSRLEQGEPGGSETDLTAIVADLHERYGCQVVVGQRLQSRRFEADIWSAMTGTIGDVVQLLARELSANRIDVDLPNSAQPTLRISHDGQRLIGRPEQLAAVRAVVGHSGASLEIEPLGTTEVLIVDWSS